MPGSLFHLAFVEEIYRQTNLPLDKITFMAGTLIPDMANNKKLSHYRVNTLLRGFLVPDLQAAGRDLLVPSDAVKMGAFCHLYLDHYFIKYYIIACFTWDLVNKTVGNPRNGKVWTFEDFFSDNGMYGAYSEINALLLKDNLISMDTINKIPIILPETSLAVFDDRHEKSWRQQLDEYLMGKRPYTGEIFDYVHVWRMLELIAQKFVREALNPWQKGY